MTKSYQFEAADELVIRKLSEESSVVVPHDLARQIYHSLDSGQLIWIDGGEQDFVCEFKRNDEVLFECHLMSTGNLVVDDQLFLGPPKLDDFLHTTMYR
ncbi:MAG: hypothetical protein IH991_18330 [Planctomycetes bacterium]|nr:hypothetical protein [Planctomycetota bacterium]